MQPKTKAKLVDCIQKWLDDEVVSDDLGGNLGMWQDPTSARKNANLFADAVDLAIRSMALQAELEKTL